MRETMAPFAASDRRRVLAGLGTLLLAPALLAGSLARAARAIAAPTQPVVLRRVLERGLSQGNAIIVTRDWRCEFAARDDGMIVSGRQIGVEIAAPERLAPLAKLERERDASAIFPITLDAEGMIASAGTPEGDVAMLRGAAASRAILDAMATPIGGPVDPTAFLSTIAGMSAAQFSRLPTDLFFPLVGEWHDHRTLPLDDGRSGTVDVRVTARADAVTGLLIASERVVDTRVGDTARRSREAWSIVRDWGR